MTRFRQQSLTHTCIRGNAAVWCPDKDQHSEALGLPCGASCHHQTPRWRQSDPITSSTSTHLATIAFILLSIPHLIRVLTNARGFTQRAKRRRKKAAEKVQSSRAKRAKITCARIGFEGKNHWRRGCKVGTKLLPSSLLFQEPIDIKTPSLPLFKSNSATDRFRSALGCFHNILQRPDR